MAAMESAASDAAMDYYGKRLATSYADGNIAISSVPPTPDPPVLLSGIHSGPVWQSSWAHPRFGNLLASCSSSPPRVVIWKEASPGKWVAAQRFFDDHGDDEHQSVNSIAWAPYQLGLVLACASSDGSISILTSRSSSSEWDTARIQPAHEGGVAAVSWSPAVPPGSLFDHHPLPAPVISKRLASCGCDKTVKVWKLSDGSAWKLDCFPPLSKHSDWVRDVAWAPNLGLPRSTMASASQDGTVVIWTQESDGEHWKGKLLHDFGAPVYRVAWSDSALLLAVSDATGSVSLWKEVVDGEWKQVSSV